MGSSTTIDVYFVLTMWRDPQGRDRYKVMADEGDGEFVDATKDYEVAAATSECGTKHGFTVLRRHEAFDPEPDRNGAAGEHCGDPLHGYPCTCYLDDSEE